MSRKSSINKIKRDNSQSNNIAASLVMYLYEKGHPLITTRFQGMGLSECDILSVNKSDYICEYEIKISRADFKKDFIKEKHRLITEKVFNESVTIKKIGKRTFELPNPYYMPNYFNFVVPENLISIDEVPEYAGLIYLKPLGFDVIKKAPLLHKTKATNEFIRSLAHQLSCKLVFKKVE